MSRSRSDNSQVASSVPFDNEGNDFESDNVQEAIQEVGISASPGFSWGRSGNANNGTWLQNDGVPSNRAGRFVFVNQPELFQIFVSNEDIKTFEVSVFEHDGDSINLTLLDTIVITSARGGTKQSSVAVTQGKQLALQITSGSAKNIVAGVIIKGKN